LFTQLITTSQKCNQELIRSQKLGGEIIGRNLHLVISYAWIDVIKQHCCNDRKVILKSFEYGEITVETYYKALRNNMKRHHSRTTNYDQRATYFNKGRLQ
jgi:hypothetical protein